MYEFIFSNIDMSAIDSSAFDGRRIPEFPNSGVGSISICNARKRMAIMVLQNFGYSYDIFANLAARTDNKR
jgi:hypothetical protein